MQSRNRTEDMTQKVNNLFQQVSLTKEDLSNLRKDIAQQEQDVKELKKVLTTIHGDVTKYQRDLKEEMTTMKTTILSSMQDMLVSQRK